MKKAPDYLQCLKAEAGLYARPQVGSVYIGGGTPSTLTVVQIHELFRLVREHFDVTDGCEVTVEVNPEGLEEGRLEAFRECGVNRISLGIQSLQDRYLTYLGRLHDARTACEAYEAVRAAGFSNVSCDLMISFPGQTDDELLRDQSRLIEMGPEHISLYSLTIEPPSRFFAQKVRLPADEIQARHLELTVEAMARAGYRRYEVSNFARTGYDSQHNLNYWNGGDYVGLGMGAHSHLDGERFFNVDRLAEYMRRLKAGENPRAGTERLTKEQRLVEALLLGLRMTVGVDVTKLEKRFGCRLDEERRGRIAAYIKEGFLEREGAVLRATPAGMLVLDEISARLF